MRRTLPATGGDRFLKPSPSGQADRQAFTLIEVVASLLLLAILLTTVLMAYGRHARQIRQAHQRLAAIQACDQFITHWLAHPSQYAHRTSGRLAGQPPLLWRMVALNSPAADLLDAQLIRCELYQVSPDGPSQPITHVDLLMAKPEPPQTVQQGQQGQKQDVLQTE